MNRRLFMLSFLLVAGAFSFAASCGWMETASCSLHFHCESSQKVDAHHSSDAAPVPSDRACFSENPTQKPPESVKVEAPVVALIAPTPTVLLPKSPHQESSWTLAGDERPKSPPLVLSYALRAPPLFA